jgi:hypothetical protein
MFVSLNSSGVWYLRFNPEDLSLEFLPVGGDYPGSPNGTVFDETSAVYVDKLNRIYMFGGVTRRDVSSQYKNAIWYIDLSTLSSE